MKQISRSTIVLIAGDWLALALFVYLGQIEHELVNANGLPRLLTTTLVLALPWTAVALLWGAYRPPAGRGDVGFFGRVLAAWLAAAPLALMLRAWLQGQSAIILIFMAVTLGLGGLFLLGWRLLYFRLHTARV